MLACRPTFLEHGSKVHSAIVMQFHRKYAFVLAVAVLVIWCAFCILRATSSEGLVGDRRDTRTDPSSLSPSVECDYWVQKYADLHKQMVEDLARGSDAVKTLVYVCKSNCGGLGDRVSGIISAFYTAVVMKRLFVIDSVHPLPLRHTLIPTPLINWDVSHLLPKHSSPAYIDAKDSHARSEKIYSELFAAHDAGKQHIHFRVNRYHVGMNLWSLRDSSHPRSGEMLKVYRSHCCVFQPCVKPSPIATFRAAFSALFLFSPMVMERVATMQQDIGLIVGSGVIPYIALHARIGGQRHGQTSWSDPSRHSLADVNTFLSCGTMTAREFQESQNETEPAIVAFSDDPAFLRKISALDERVKHSKNSLIIHVDRSKLDDHEELEKGVIDTFAELFIISRAQCIVGSSSTFSAVAGSIFLPPGEHQRCHKFFAECGSHELPYDFWLLEGLR